MLLPRRRRSTFRHMMVSTNSVARLNSGNIFASNINNAHPPLSPGKESSTPADLFPEVHKTFLEGEHRRMAAFVSRSAGCIDLRSVRGIRLCEPGSGHDGLKGKEEKCFEVQIASEANIVLEAHSPEIAKEWVDRLLALQAYWRRRHRVE